MISNTKYAFLKNMMTFLMIFSTEFTTCPCRLFLSLSHSSIIYCRCYLQVATPLALFIRPHKCLMPSKILQRQVVAPAQGKALTRTLSRWSRDQHSCSFLPSPSHSSHILISLSKTSLTPSTKFGRTYPAPAPLQISR
jgi:hypothetical protein